MNRTVSRLVKPTIIITSVFVSATALAAHVGTKETRVTIEENTDYPGRDYKEIKLREPNSKAAPALSSSCGQTILGGATSFNEYTCARRCLDDDKCKAWAYKERLIGAGGTCFLKDSVPTRQSTPSSGRRSRTAGVKGDTPDEVNACLEALSGPAPEKAPEDYVFMMGISGLVVSPYVKVQKVAPAGDEVECMMACYLDPVCRSYSYASVDESGQCNFYDHNNPTVQNGEGTFGDKVGVQGGKTFYRAIDRDSPAKVNANKGAGVSLGLDNEAYCAGVCLAPGIVGGKNCRAYHLDLTTNTCHLFEEDELVKANGFTGGVMKK